MGRGVDPPRHQNGNNQAGPEHSTLDPGAQALGAFIDETQAPDNEELSQDVTDGEDHYLAGQANQAFDRLSTGLRYAIIHLAPCTKE